MELKKTLLFFFFLLAPHVAFAEYDAKCLAECFGTGHDCYFCNYICYHDYYTRPVKPYPYPEQRPCDLENLGRLY
ncbi:MAG: hypothetical protein H0W64_02760 [Gammaproteobacteria bacterium]|nr:hypothetical protein [Gammaproteobacteria bacterium]